MIKKITVGICLLVSLISFAQQGTSSPYSYYGIGDIKFKGTVENRSMGGLSVFRDSIHINLQNPAHFSGLKLTCFTVGGTYSSIKLATDTQNEKNNRTSFDYFAVGIPAGKFGIGFGILPYSSVGYKIETISDEAEPIYSKYDGIGGVDKVFFGFGYQLTKKLAFGADIQYNFGDIETTAVYFKNDVQYGTRERNISYTQGFNANLGLTFNTKWNNKLSFSSSLTYSPESELKIENKRSIEVVLFTNSDRVIAIEKNDTPVDNTTIKIPAKVALGAGIGQLKKWSVGGEITFLNNEVMSNRFSDIEGGTFENSIRYSLGGFFIPNYIAYSDYYKKMTYRWGLRYENTGLVVQDESINDRAVNLGVGLPIGGTFSNVNIGLEYGIKGTKENNLVQENYLSLSVGLSLSDRWFVKRKYD